MAQWRVDKIQFMRYQINFSPVRQHANLPPNSKRAASIVILDNRAGGNITKNGG